MAIYPPIVDTYMPAFIASKADSECKVYFSLSKYNAIGEIKGIIVAVNSQFTNESVLDNELYPTGFLSFSSATPEIWTEKYEDKTRTGDDRYFISIKDSDIKNGWTVNQFYKVQIRFSSVSLPESLTQAWLVDNESNFSEWSTVALIQGISQPTLTLKRFSNNETIFTAMDNVVVGRLTFEDAEDEESLESYRIKIFNRENIEEIVFDSGVVYTNEYNPNEINYFINYAFTDGEQYLMKFSYTTRSLYHEEEEFFFTIIELGGEALEAKISATPDEEEGRIKIHVSSETNRFFGNLTIRRASSETDFKIWEDVHTAAIISEDYLDFTWYDYTVESGVWYKYCVQKRNALGDRGLIISIEDPVSVVLQDMFLTRADKQLKIKFNPKINSFKHTLSESLSQTIGSKYPFIKRNGNVNYRQFSISGLISHFMDENELFMPVEERYSNQKNLYDIYNDKNRINEYNDFTLERVFRDNVKEFLYENNVKLFRSPSEGNILVRLMDVNFSPEETLGRMIYSFSATAYEIDEISFDNFEKYGIQKVGEVSKYIVNTYEVTSQYSGDIKGSLLAAIQSKETGTQTEGLTKKVTSFSNINLVFESDPYLINTSASGNSTIVKDTDTTSENTVLGHLIKVNGIEIIVGPGGQYTLTDSDVQVKDIEFVKEENISIDITYSIDEYEERDELPSQIYYTSRVGQLWGLSKPDISLYNAIDTKYSRYYKNESYQRLFALNTLKIEAEPNTIFYIKDATSNKFKRFMIGDTGYLKINTPDYPVLDFYCLGTFLTKKEQIIDGDTMYYLERTKDYEYVNMISQGTYATVDKIIDPVKNGVYLVNNFTNKLNFNASDNNYFSQLGIWIPTNGPYKVIYYQDNWYPFIEDENIIDMDEKKETAVIKPCQILIDYQYELEEGEFH